MTRFLKKMSKKIGIIPGSLIHIGEKKVKNTKITFIDYDKEKCTQGDLQVISDISPFTEKPTVTWINVIGLHNPDIIAEIGKLFQIHPLVLEDILNTDHPSKIEEFDQYVFIVLKILQMDNDDELISAEQVSIILSKNYVVTFLESESKIFEPVISRIVNDRGRIRKMGADYLAYTLFDVIVDSYFLLLEHLGEKIESVEEELVEHPTQDTLQAIHKLKREMIFLRKSIWPLRELVNALIRIESTLVSEATEIYFKDVYDHTIQVIDTIESYRDLVYGMLDTYLSMLSNKMNEIMKVLTIIATIFIPLTFIAGVYGMNFVNIPELKWHWGYLYFWIVMIVVFLLMMYFFKRKKWL